MSVFTVAVGAHSMAQCTHKQTVLASRSCPSQSSESARVIWWLLLEAEHGAAGVCCVRTHDSAALVGEILHVCDQNTGIGPGAAMNNCRKILR